MGTSRATLTRSLFCHRQEPDLVVLGRRQADMERHEHGGDAKGLKGFGQARQMNIDVFGERAMGFHEKAFDGEPGAGKCHQSNHRPANELPASQHKER